MSPTSARPAPIRTDDSNAFANNTVRARLPAIVDEVIALNADYPASIKEELRHLRDELAGGASIVGLDPESAPDHEEWTAAIERQRAIVNGELSWHNAEWFFAETYAYRCLVEAVRWRESRRDPFLPKKLEELQGAALWRLLERALAPCDSATGELSRALLLDLWANRIDLSYQASLSRGAEISPDDLLVDDRAAVLAQLGPSGSAADGAPERSTVYIVVDNAGSELALDLALSDFLLRHTSERVALCLKAHPTFVSDATVEDVWMMLRKMSERGERIAALGQRLQDFWQSGRLRWLPHPYWNSSRFLWDLPPGLERHFNAAQLVIIKGDANYRRAVGDALWPAHTPFTEVLDYLDAPALCLRTLKSDPIVGLPSPAHAAALDRVDPDWRVNGKRGVIQFKPQPWKRQ